MARQIVLPYTPRDCFKPFHDRTKRWAALIAHRRRSGKTVSSVNDLIRGAITCKTANPLFAYIAPFRMQAKSVAWAYLKHYARPIIESVNEGELLVRLINKSEVRLFGADNADSLRGLGFDGVLCDEYGDFAPSVFGSVIRPALADKQGWCCFMGTPKGKNQFWDIAETARTHPDDWYYLNLPASKSGILPESEIGELKAQLTPDQFLQEMECSFEAAIRGAFYGIEMRELQEAGQIREVKYDPSLTTFTAWDIGHRDDTSIWWFQIVGTEIHIIDFHTVSGSGVEELGKFVASKPYHYTKHYLPHDARAKTFASNGKSTIEQLIQFLGFENLAIVPSLSVQDGIQAVRMTLPHCYFDSGPNVQPGIEALRQYEREYDEDTKAFRANPKHNWASNPADAFRMLAISWREAPKGTGKPANSDIPLMAGPLNKSTLNDAWAAHAHRSRKVARI